MPLAFAAAWVKQVVASEALERHGSADLNGIASFMGRTILIYTYLAHSPRSPKVIPAAQVRQARFKTGATELHFVDGRPPLSSLAVNPRDVECVVEMLNHPGDEAVVRGRHAKRWPPAGAR